VIAAAFLAEPSASVADDAGPHRDIRAIRHDAPIILANFVRRNGFDPSQLTIDDVVVRGDQALVQWHVRSNIGVDGFIRMYRSWWHRTSNYPIPNVSYEVCYEPLACTRVHGVTTADFIARGFAPETVALAALHLPAIGERVRDYAFDTYDASIFALSGSERIGALDPDGYGIKIQFAPTDATAGAFLRVTGRRPTQAESWITPGGNSYFFFSATVHATQPVHVHAGTTIDVWFPFVLDPSYRYSLTIAGSGFTAIGPIDGTLFDNIVHFVLPAFTAPPGTDLMGEIESD